MASKLRGRSIEVIFNEMRYINLCFTYLLTDGVWAMSDRALLSDLPRIIAMAITHGRLLNNVLVGPIRLEAVWAE